MLHHLPDLQESFDEFYRLLKPGGMIFFAGEPSETGDRLANYPKRAGHKLSPLWRKALRVSQPLVRRRPRRSPPASAARSTSTATPSSTWSTSTPSARASLAEFAKTSGFDDVRVIGEELSANWFGWFNRALEADGVPEDIP